MNKCKLVPFVINDTILNLCSSYKYLGVHISENQSWATYIRFVIISASQSLGFIKRNIKLTPHKLKLLAYISVIPLKYEHASAFGMLIDATFPLIAQNCAIHFIYLFHSYDTSIPPFKRLAKHLNLSFQWKHYRLILFHKFYHSVLNDPAYSCPSARFSSCNRHSHHVWPPKTNTVTLFHPHFSSTAVNQNDVPQSAVTLSNNIGFKNAPMEEMLE